MGKRRVHEDKLSIFIKLNGTTFRPIIDDSVRGSLVGCMENIVNIKADNDSELVKSETIVEAGEKIKASHMSGSIHAKIKKNGEEEIWTEYVRQFEEGEEVIYDSFPITNEEDEELKFREECVTVTDEYGEYPCKKVKVKPIEGETIFVVPPHEISR